MDSQHANRHASVARPQGCELPGPKVEGYLDGKLYLDHVLPEPVSGRIGLWSKADSHMYFDDYTVMPAD